MKQSSKLSRNEETPAKVARVSKSVVFAFDGADTDRSIIPIYLFPVNHRLKLIHTAARYAVSLQGSFHLSIRKKITKGIIIIMYALDDRRNKLKVKSALMLEPKGELTANQDDERCRIIYMISDMDRTEVTIAYRFVACLNTGYPTNGLMIAIV